jgi:hypothetical protein
MMANGQGQNSGVQLHCPKCSSADVKSTAPVGVALLIGALVFLVVGVGYYTGNESIFPLGLCIGAAIAGLILWAESSFGANTECLSCGQRFKAKKKAPSWGWLTAICVVGAVIAGYNYLMSRDLRVYNYKADNDARNAYSAAQAYFMDYPTGPLTTTDILLTYGFRQTTDVTAIPSGTTGDFTIITYHGSGDRTYTVASDRSITNN